MLVLGLFYLTFFAATIYSAVILIQLGSWLTILAGLLLFCSYFLTGGLILLGLGTIIENKKKLKKEEEK